MLARLAIVESELKHVAKDMSILSSEMKDVRERLSRLEVKVDHLPAKGYFVTALFLLLGAIAGLIAFAEKISALVAGA